MFTEFGLVIIALIDANTRSIWIEIERIPSYGEGIASRRMSSLVSRYAPFKLILANVALNGVSGVFLVKTSSQRTLTHGQTVSDTIETLKLVILRDV